jgi:ribosomal protein S18 acetylase RimI-like enzyme
VPTQTVAVRPVRPEELDAVADLTARVYREAGIGSAQYEPALRDVASRARTATVLVAESGGRLVGAVTVATRLGPWAEQAVRGEAVIRMLVVDPAARGRGVGEALVLGCLDAARADGCSLVRLSSQDESAAAQRLYGRLGFTRVPALDWEPVDGVLLRAFAADLEPPAPPLP